MTFKVIVPNKSFAGKRAGVKFRGGIGIFEDEKTAKRLAEDFGYKIEKVKESKAEDKGEPAKEDDESKGKGKSKK